MPKAMLAYCVCLAYLHAKSLSLSLSLFQHPSVSPPPLPPLRLPPGLMSGPGSSSQQTTVEELLAFIEGDEADGGSGGVGGVSAVEPSPASSGPSGKPTGKKGKKKSKKPVRQGKKLVKPVQFIHLISENYSSLEVCPVTKATRFPVTQSIRMVSTLRVFLTSVNPSPVVL